MRSFVAPHLSGALRSLALLFRDSAMSFVAIPWLCFANRLQCHASLFPRISNRSKSTAALFFADAVLHCAIANQV
jgi:hypothetical protein